MMRDGFAEVGARGLTYFRCFDLLVAVEKPRAGGSASPCFVTKSAGVTKVIWRWGGAHADERTRVIGQG